MPDTKKKSSEKTVCLILLALYALLTLAGALRHEIWFDEAQAWTIARDNTPAGIIDQLRYEGHPPLWYFILYIFAHAGFSCAVIPLISWFFSVIAAGVIMLKAPFGVPMKAALVFSGGMLFFNSVMSRPYCLIYLFASLAAALYPERKKHPVLFGAVIALLADTHICICGFIGIMGLYMIYDLVKDWKTNGKKQNVLNLTGLALSGAGVLMLVLPLIGSLGLNSSTSKNNITAASCFDSVISSFYNISYAAVSGIGSSILLTLLSAVMCALFLAVIVLLRHRPRAFAAALLFCAFYIITTEIFWITIPNRAHVFIFMLFIILWISESEPEKRSAPLDADKIKTDTKAIKKLIEAVFSADNNYMKSCRAALTLIMAMTVPVGVFYLASDLTKCFCPAAEAAEYITENFPKGTVFVTTDDSAAQFAAYLPDYRFYSTDYSEFYTCTSHKKAPEEKNTDKTKADLGACESVYGLFCAIDADMISSNNSIVYTRRGNVPFGTNIGYIEIYEYKL